MLVAVALTSIATALLGLPVETIGTRFGGFPSGLPFPSLPELSLEKVQAVLPMLHSVFLLGFMHIASPLAAYIHSPRWRASSRSSPGTWLSDINSCCCFEPGEATPLCSLRPFCSPSSAT